MHKDIKRKKRWEKTEEIKMTGNKRKEIFKKKDKSEK